jgi:hypothetical protein
VLPNVFAHKTAWHINGSEDCMTELFIPMLGSMIVIGGSTAGLVLLIIIIVLLVR